MRSAESSLEHRRLLKNDIVAYCRQMPAFAIECEMMRNASGIDGILPGPLVNLVIKYTCPQYLHALRELSFCCIPLCSARRPGNVIRSMASSLRELPGASRYLRKPHAAPVMRNIIADVRRSMGWESRLDIFYRFMLATWEPAAW